MSASMKGKVKAKIDTSWMSPSIYEDKVRKIDLD